MTLDQSLIERNRASTDRIRALVARLTDEEMRQPVGEHWTVAIALAHLAFWDRPRTKAKHAMHACAWLIGSC